MLEQVSATPVRSKLQEALCPAFSLHGSTLPPWPPLTAAQAKAKTPLPPAASAALPTFGVKMSPARHAYETPLPSEVGHGEPGEDVSSYIW